MGRMEGKVAFVTGAARGQGRSHAVRLAEEGADIIAVDICQNIPHGFYPMGTKEELDETVAAVEALDRRIVAYQADVRDLAALQKAADDGAAALGHIDTVVANAGVYFPADSFDMSEGAWQEMIDINLTGQWKTVKATIPHLKANGSGSVVITSSLSMQQGNANTAHYAAAKAGLVGMMQVMAADVAELGIRFNSVHPTTVDTMMIHGGSQRTLFRPDIVEPTREDVALVTKKFMKMDIPWVEPIDISNAVLFLASDESRYVTGLQLYVDAGGRLV